MRLILWIYNSYQESILLNRILLFSFMLTFLSGAGGGQVGCIEDSLAGSWKGVGQIIVTWCTQNELQFELDIAPDGTVTGRIGDATIADGKIEQRSALMRWLGNGEYILTGDLSGDLVARESIRRESFVLMFGFDQGFIDAEMNSSGTPWGGKDRMIMKVVNIHFHRRG